MSRASWNRLALTEADEAFGWHLERSPGTARAFSAAVDEAIQTALAFPNAGRATGGTFRRLTLSGYPFVLVYRQTTRGIRVLAFASTSRQPDYWRNRS